MKQRPIIFSKPMVLAILGRHKNQTRRLVKLQGKELLNGMTGNQVAQALKAPYGIPGDKLWIKETWRAPPKFDHHKPSQLPKDIPIEYRADGESGYDSKWRTPLFMPRWASRINLEIIEVRTERLQEISEEDAKAEGMNCKRDPVLAYRGLWEDLHGTNSWITNPLVWVIEFIRVK